MLRERAGAIPFLVLDSDGDLTRQGFGNVTVAAKPIDSAALDRLVSSQLGRESRLPETALESGLIRLTIGPTLASDAESPSRIAEFNCSLATRPSG